eukprot:7379691-Prymnesium_polylepis.3
MHARLASSHAAVRCSQPSGCRLPPLKGIGFFCSSAAADRGHARPTLAFNRAWLPTLAAGPDHRRHLLLDHRERDDSIQ